MIYSDSNCIIWKAEFRPHPTRPKDVRQLLNSVIRHEFSTRTSYMIELIQSIHSLALIVNDFAVVSTCGKYVAQPAEQGALLAVAIVNVVKDTSPEYIRAEAWADALKRYEDHRPAEYSQQ